MTDVIVEVLGGVVQNVAVNRKNVRVVLIDWDNIADSKGEEEPEWLPLGDVPVLGPRNGGTL